MLKAVLFDMDGVLIDSEPENKRVMQEIAGELGFVLTEDEKQKFSGVGAKEQWMTMKNEHGFSKSPEELAEKESLKMGEYYRKGNLMPIEHSIKLLKECANAGIKIAVASSSVRKNVEAVLERLCIKSYIEEVVSGDMVERTKPSPDIFLKAAAMLKVSPKECVVIEDAEKGIEAAKAAGMKAVGIMHRDNPQDLSAADAIFTTKSRIDIEFLRKLAE